MLKKPLTYISLLGALLIIAGLVFNPSLLVKFKSGGHFQSGWTVTKIHISQYYLIFFGCLSVLASLIMSRIPKEKRPLQIIFCACIIGILLTISGLILSPYFIQKSFSPIKFLEDNNMVLLRYLQLVTIIIGFSIIIISLLIYRKRYLNPQRKYGWAILIFILLFLLLIDRTYIKSKYPSNIITQPSEYGKIVDLLLGRDILHSDFDPRSTLIVKRKYITKAKYPVIDINFHLRSDYQTGEDKRVLEPQNLVKSMDSVGLKIIVNTDGFWPNLDRYPKQYPDRFIIFEPTWFPSKVMSDEELAELPNSLEKAFQKGARGDGEVWKYLGSRTRDENGLVIPVDDPRLDPLWAKAGELGIPFLWHMIDPVANFQPIDKHNERYVMLSRYPEFSFYDPGRIPSREIMIKGRENVLRKHPETIFIGCHMGMNPENLAYVAYLLDTYPNYYVEISTVVSELGRQPITARKFFIKYQNRILFGTDGGSLFGVKGWTVEKFYQAYFEFLETENEYFSYPLQGAINQGDWKIYGINLPDSALEKIYYKNAEKILFENKNNLQTTIHK
jgi:uncharacterized protein